MQTDDDEIDQNNWECKIFKNDGIPAIGQRLGVSYLQSTMEHVELNVGSHSLKLFQSSMGLMAISGVVWDAGFCLTDYLICNPKLTAATNILDVGCGTGVCGLGALLLGASTVTFTDMVMPPSLDENLSQLPEDIRSRATFVAHDWSAEKICSELIRPIVSDGILSDAISWDIVLCSDLLYDRIAHEPLLRVLRQISFKKTIFGYKRRTDSSEIEFFRALCQFCDIRVIEPGSFKLHNLSVSATSGLFIVIATPKVI
jgi:predicted nicotinamide N-methyase